MIIKSLPAAEEDLEWRRNRESSLNKIGDGSGCFTVDRSCLVVLTAPSLASNSNKVLLWQADGKWTLSCHRHTSLAHDHSLLCLLPLPWLQRPSVPSELRQSVGHRRSKLDIPCRPILTGIVP